MAYTTDQETLDGVDFALAEMTREVMGYVKQHKKPTDKQMAEWAQQLKRIRGELRT